jgi:hypothetical protein
MDLRGEYLMALYAIHKFPVSVEAILTFIATCERINSCIRLVGT